MASSLPKKREDQFASEDIVRVMSPTPLCCRPLWIKTISSILLFIKAHNTSVERAIIS
jgi:hypothetical protein